MGSQPWLKDCAKECVTVEGYAVLEKFVGKIMKGKKLKRATLLEIKLASAQPIFIFFIMRPKDSVAKLVKIYLPPPFLEQTASVPKCRSLANLS